MLRNILNAALRNLLRNRLYTCINIVGLAVAFAAAVFAALFIHNELSYDRWIPGHGRIYALATTFSPDLSMAPQERIGAYRDAVPTLPFAFPEIGTASRLGRQTGILRHGTVHGQELLAWADANFFDTIPLSSVAGELHTALVRPDSIVMTRKLARKYFGQDAPIGATVFLDSNPLQVTAIIEDWPANSTFTADAFVSERAPFLFWKQRQPWNATMRPRQFPYELVDEAFISLKPGASIANVRREMSAFSDRYVPTALMGKTRLRLVPLAALHLDPAFSADAPEKRTRLLAAIAGVGAIGVLVVLAAILNFVNLMTARASGRAVEVGVRKLSGATYRALVLQFLGEAMAYALLGMLVACCVVYILCPAFQGFLQANITFRPFHDGWLAVALCSAALLSGVLAGGYPAFVLARLRPAAVLHAGSVLGSGSAAIRQGLVVLQFAILIGLGIATAVIYQQTDFAVKASGRLDTDLVLRMSYACSVPMKQEVLRLPGVSKAACTWAGIGGAYASSVTRDSADNPALEIAASPIDDGFFEVLGVTPKAGRFFAREYGEDLASADGSTNPSVVINESAVRRLGFKSADAAVGETLLWKRLLVARAPIGTRPFLPSRIIGVVRDLPRTVDRPVDALIYYADMSMAAPAPEFGPGWDVGQNLYLKLTGNDVPATLEAIDRLGERLGNSSHPVQRRFLKEDLEVQYRDMLRQGELIAVFTGIGVFIAVVGLFGLSAFLADRRTKEIGIRKSLGADAGNILRLLLWQLTRPVLLSSLVAWPVAYLVMKHWLEGFAYHVDLDPRVFVAASAIASILAALTVAGHALAVSRAEPVAALRYE